MKKRKPKTKKRPTSPRGAGPRPDTSWHARFLEYYRKEPIIAAARMYAGIARSTFYEHKNVFPDFARAVEDAEADGLDRLEACVFRRATDGVPRKKFNKNGEPIMDPETGKQYVEYEHSDSLAQFTLRSRRPEVYGDKSKVEVSATPLNEEEAIAAAIKAEKSLLLTVQASVMNRMREGQAAE